MQAEARSIGGPGEDDLAADPGDAEARAVYAASEAVETAVAVQKDIVKSGAADKKASYINIPMRIHADAVSPVVIGAAGLLDPELMAGSIEFGGTPKDVRKP